MRAHERLTALEQAVEQADIARIKDAVHRIAPLAGVSPEIVIDEAVRMYRAGVDTSDAGLAADIRLLAQQMGRSEAEVRDEYDMLLQRGCGLG